MLVSYLKNFSWLKNAFYLNNNKIGNCQRNALNELGSTYFTQLNYRKRYKQLIMKHHLIRRFKKVS